MTNSIVMATIVEGIDRNSLLHWGFSVFMVLGGVFMMWVAYRFFIDGSTVKTVIGTVSIRAQSRLGFVARAVLFGAIGLGSVLGGLMFISTMLYGWP